MPVTTIHLDEAPVETAPDGSRVRPLVRVDQASMAHFELEPGATTYAVKHRSISELWFVVAGSGTLWRDGIGKTPLRPGVALALEAGVAFQFRAGILGLEIVAATIPTWPGDAEAERAAGVWPS